MHDCFAPTSSTGHAVFESMDAQLCQPLTCEWQRRRLREGVPTPAIAFDEKRPTGGSYYALVVVVLLVDVLVVGVLVLGVVVVDVLVVTGVVVVVVLVDVVDVVVVTVVVLVVGSEEGRVGSERRSRRAPER